MKVSVLLFAEAKLAVGAATLELSLPEKASVAQLRRQLSERFPGLEPLLKRSSIAVNQRFVDDVTILCERDEVAWIPPVSGG